MDAERDVLSITVLGPGLFGVEETDQRAASLHRCRALGFCLKTGQDRTDLTDSETGPG